MIHYVGERYRQTKEESLLLSYLAEAFLLYAVPQLDGLSNHIIREVCENLNVIFTPAGLEDGGACRASLGCILVRIQDMYPHLDLAILTRAESS
jgi:hypothetical protein